MDSAKYKDRPMFTPSFYKSRAKWVKVTMAQANML